MTNKTIEQEIEQAFDNDIVSNDVRWLCPSFMNGKASLALGETVILNFKKDMLWELCHMSIDTDSPIHFYESIHKTIASCKYASLSDAKKAAESLWQDLTVKQKAQCVAPVAVAEADPLQSIRRDLEVSAAVRKPVREIIVFTLPPGYSDKEIDRMVEIAMDPKVSTKSAILTRYHPATMAGVATRKALMKQQTQPAQPFTLKKEWVKKPYGFRLNIGNLSFYVEKEPCEDNKYCLANNIIRFSLIDLTKRENLTYLEKQIFDLVIKDSEYPFNFSSNPEKLMLYVNDCINTVLKELHDEMQAIAEVQHD